jgi:hypothetical protein
MPRIRRRLEDPVSEWAGTRGFSYTGMDGKGFALKGTISGKPWKMERGRASRDYIRGEELRARAELKLNDDVSVLIMNRPLKEALEKRAYQAYTDTLQTTADPSLPEEMRWLAMYSEVGWESLPKPFWQRYAVMADQRVHAQAWLDTQSGRAADVLARAVAGRTGAFYPDGAARQNLSAHAIHPRRHTHAGACRANLHQRLRVGHCGPDERHHDLRYGRVWAA